LDYFDDEQNGTGKYLTVRSKVLPGSEVVAESRFLLSGIEAIQQYTPDLVFLELKCPEGKGFKSWSFQ